MRSTEWHVEEGERMRNDLGQSIGKPDNLAAIARLDEMFGLEIAVAEVDPQFDVGRIGAQMRCMRAESSLRRLTLRRPR